MRRLSSFTGHDKWRSHTFTPLRAWHVWRCGALLAIRLARYPHTRDEDGTEDDSSRSQVGPSLSQPAAGTSRGDAFDGNLPVAAAATATLPPHTSTDPSECGTRRPADPYIQ
eukprot:gene12218-biopygen1181